MWFLFALLSSVFAALTSILAKLGIEGVNSNLATALRTLVVLAMAWGMVFLTGSQSGIDNNVADRETRMGTPSLPGLKFHRSNAVFRNLPELSRQVRELEKQLEALKKEMK